MSMALSGQLPQAQAVTAVSAEPQARIYLAGDFPWQAVRARQAGITDQPRRRQAPLRQPTR